MTSALSDYQQGFAKGDPFLTWFQIDEHKQVISHHFSRDQFREGARKAVAVLRRFGLSAGDRLVHGFGANDPRDLMFRLGAAYIGAVPVTVNWEADTSERIQYKIETTGAKLLIHDEAFGSNQLPQLQLTDLPVYDTGNLEQEQPVHTEDPRQQSDERLIIFTSGTTGQPKGVCHDFQSYQTNAETFDDFMEVGDGKSFGVLVVNAMHHSNSSSMTDWCLRRANARLFMVSRYTTAYWRILAEVRESFTGRLIAPVVARHFDFLAALDEEKRLPLPAERLKAAMTKVRFLIGSAPVGPTTTQRIIHYAGRLPTVRFGSTETCLQVVGIPKHLDEEACMQAFRRGWEHGAGPGFYIGRPHPPHTQARIVRSVTRGDANYLQEAEPGEPGYVITAGKNVMSHYVGNPEATSQVLDQGWYLGLLDIGFYMNNPDGTRDFYWKSRESTLLIRGGANYAYDQINDEIQPWLCKQLGASSGALDLAVVGLRLDSEHEDTACLTVELKDEVLVSRKEEIRELLLGEAAKALTKGARPDRVRFGDIPRNFKGAVTVKALKASWSD